MPRQSLFGGDTHRPPGDDLTVYSFQVRKRASFFSKCKEHVRLHNSTHGKHLIDMILGLVEESRQHTCHQLFRLRFQNISLC
ncbi:hypothetical protein PISMIDRAFT_598559 [Pisolithus microcarpus 441]|uniref:Uncharacterized protein n=1 Tax=Pisolithus microcarpus 441 TaxID=765257 RepID=A0A0C9Z1R0_9AGAM|nr:hypothetical protein PISMIDRAFT_598559 [Pisolithus microcarpus 441]